MQIQRINCLNRAVNNRSRSVSKPIQNSYNTPSFKSRIEWDMFAQDWEEIPDPQPPSFKEEVKTFMNSASAKKIKKILAEKKLSFPESFDLIGQTSMREINDSEYTHFLCHRVNISCLYVFLAEHLKSPDLKEGARAIYNESIGLGDFKDADCRPNIKMFETTAEMFAKMIRGY
jgi:hypothetical protein